MTSHAEYDLKTSGLEVAKVFGDRIRGKNGKSKKQLHPQASSQ